MAEAYQSLYRRYRPQRFSEVRGQDHVTTALRNAIRNDRVAHAYLFSGPRGTGKTSVARILAKALNCESLVDGEPDDSCEPCRQIREGTSFDVIELDAASNSRVDEMRDLLPRVNLGAAGRRKVFIVDEVHMLSTAASNALLKTLEEPPEHVVFVLATTNPEKVLETIRSRTQHFEFHLLPTDVLGELVRDINKSADLGMADDTLDRVVRRGSGSARDALSALDQAFALGGIGDEVDTADEITEAICDSDTARALAALAAGCSSGRDVRHLAEELLERLRNVLLSRVAPAVLDLPDAERQRVADQAGRLSAAAITRAMEAVGEGIALMKDALDPRVSLEVALVRVTRPDADTSSAALLERIERLERAVEGGTAHAPPPRPGEEEAEIHRPKAAVTPPPSDPAPRATRPALGGVRKQAPAGSVPAQRPKPAPTRAPTRAPAPVKSAAPTAEAPAAPPPGVAGGDPPSRDDLVKAWGDVVLPKLRPRARSLFNVGRFISAEGNTATFGLPNEIHVEHASKERNEVEAALRAHFGVAVSLRLVVDGGAAVEATHDEPEETIDVTELEDAPASAADPVDWLKGKFAGAQEVEEQ
ncbi:MAG: DNA polymerase III subunit gamma/tau [Acidimicrobiia bacterium]